MVGTILKMEKIKPFNHDISAAILRIAADISHSDRVVILSGAGISTESGIPDFRGPDGVWTKNPDAERTATLQNFINNRDYRVLYK